MADREANVKLTDREIRDRLTHIDQRRLVNGISGKAGILISIVFRNEEPHFVLTRRTQTVATHKGQISFPGGLEEKKDSNLLETALRETEEEIGVDPRKIDVLGEFHDYIAITDHLVRPFVGVIPNAARFRINQQEVAYILEIPIAFFLTSVPRIERREHRGVIHDVYFFDFNGDIVWGLTARIIQDFLDSIFRQD